MASVQLIFVLYTNQGSFFEKFEKFETSKPRKSLVSRMRAFELQWDLLSTTGPQKYFAMLILRGLFIYTLKKVSAFKAAASPGELFCGQVSPFEP